MQRGAWLGGAFEQVRHERPAAADAAPLGQEEQDGPPQHKLKRKWRYFWSEGEEDGP